MMQISTSCVCRLGEDDPLLFWLPLTWAKALTRQQIPIIILMFLFALNSPFFLGFFSLRLFECLHCARLWHISGTLQDFCFVLVVVAVEQGPENDCAHFLINRPLHCRLASRWFTSLSLFGCGIFVCLVVFVFVYLWCWCHHDILRNRGHFIDFPLDNLFWNKINSAKKHKKLKQKLLYYLQRVEAFSL